MFKTLNILDFLRVRSFRIVRSTNDRNDRWRTSIDFFKANQLQRPQIELETTFTFLYVSNFTLANGSALLRYSKSFSRSL
jgi:hypothetical protein